MNRSDQMKITKNLVVIRKTLHKDIDSVIDRLIMVKVLPQEAKAELRNLKPSAPQLRCGWMVNKLLRSGPDAFKKFIYVLEDMGKHSLVQTLEKSVVADSPSMQTDREKTFIIPSPSIPERFHTKLDDMSEQKCETPRVVDEVQQLERMVTIVLSTLKEKDANTINNKMDNRKDIHQQLLSESHGSEQLMGFFKSLKRNRLSLTAHSLQSVN